MRARPVAAILAATFLIPILLGSGPAEARGRRAAPTGSSDAAPATTGSIPAQGPNSYRPPSSRDGGTIHWNTGNEWGNLGGPSGGGGGGGGQ